MNWRVVADHKQANDQAEKIEKLQEMSGEKKIPVKLEPSHGML